MLVAAACALVVLGAAVHAVAPDRVAEGYAQLSAWVPVDLGRDRGSRLELPQPRRRRALTATSGMAGATGCCSPRRRERQGRTRSSGRASMVAGWMASQGHRENILRDGYTAIGVACTTGSQGLLCAQVFLG